MHRHSELDVMVHTTDELAALLGTDVAARRQLHLWPLSLVELITTTDGTSWVYKAQREPSLEVEFYESVVSPVLPNHRVLTHAPPYSTMLIEYLDSPTIDTLDLSDDIALQHGKAIVGTIGRIDYAGAVYIDISTLARWREFVASTLGMLSGLVRDRRFVRSTEADVRSLVAWAETPSVLSAIETTSRLTHGDATGANIILSKDDYKIIDWQRPRRAPAEVDLVEFLRSRGIDPLGHVEPAVVGVQAFLHLYWAVEAKVNLLPTLEIFDYWSEDAIGRIQDSEVAADSETV